MLTTRLPSALAISAEGGSGFAAMIASSRTEAASLKLRKTKNAGGAGDTMRHEPRFGQCRRSHCAGRELRLVAKKASSFLDFGLAKQTTPLKESDATQAR